MAARADGGSRGRGWRGRAPGPDIPATRLQLLPSRPIAVRRLRLHSLVAATGVAVGLAAAHPIPAASQLLEGRLLGPDSVAPARGILVVAVSEGGRVQARSISDAQGVYRLVLPRPGSWTLRAEQLGYQVEEWPVELDADGSRIPDRVLTVRPLAIEGVDVVSSQRCPQPENPERVATLWSEARSVLAALSEGPEAAARFQVERFTEVRPAGTGPGAAAIHEERDTVWVEGAVPMYADDTERLMTDGFVRMGDDGETVTYFAPDARTLLSDAFLAFHCFRVTADAGGGRVGLSFEPVQGVTAPDVAGTFWLPTDPAVPPRIEFHFTDHLWDFRSVRDDVLRGLGGEVELRFVPGIGWIVNDWRLRLPLAVRRRGTDDRGRPRAGLPQVRERGASVLRVQVGGG